MSRNLAQDKPLRRALLLAGVLAGLVLAAPASAWALTYTFTTLDVPDAFTTATWGINDAGQIVGEFQDDTEIQAVHGFVYTRGNFSTIDVPNSLGNTNVTRPQGINNTGQIVGIFETTSKFRGFVYTGGNFSAIDAPGGLIVTAPFDINDTGQIVGYFNTVTTGTHGFLYTGGSFSTLDVPDALYTIAHGINNAGQIVGTFVNAATLEQHGFLYTDGYFRVIDVPGSFYTYATDINDTGQIVGLFGDATGEHGFIATPVPPSFAAFTATLKLKFGRRINDAFDLKSRFTLGAGNNGITPLTEEVTLTLTGGKASFTTTIPAGAFTKDRKGRFTFTGQVDGVKLDATLTLLGGQHYAFTAEGKHTDLRGIANPVTVTLTIGDDNGRTTVTAKLKDDHDKGGEGSLARHVTR